MKYSGFWQGIENAINFGSKDTFSSLDYESDDYIPGEYIDLVELSGDDIIIHGSMRNTRIIHRYSIAEAIGNGGFFNTAVRMGILKSSINIRLRFCELLIEYVSPKIEENSALEKIVEFAAVTLGENSAAGMVLHFATQVINSIREELENAKEFIRTHRETEIERENQMFKKRYEAILESGKPGTVRGKPQQADGENLAD